jgi:hypothetical protein
MSLVLTYGSYPKSLSCPEKEVLKMLAPVIPFSFKILDIDLVKGFFPEILVLSNASIPVSLQFFCYC